MLLHGPRKLDKENVLAVARVLGTAVASHRLNPTHASWTLLRHAWSRPSLEHKN